jgi:hypothetical protein
LGANVPVASLANFCGKVEPDLTIISFPLALSDEKATELVQALADEVSPVSNLAVGGHGAIAMRHLFVKSNIEIVEDFADLDGMLDRFIRQSLSRG